jgi:O-succinylbenzoate synthase
VEIDHPAVFHRLVSHIRGHEMAKAGVEMALWDIYGKQQGKSLAELLGGTRREVPVGVSIGIQPSMEKLLKAAEDYLEQGYRRIKLKIKPGRDVAETKAVREVYPDLALQVDANSAYTLENAQTLKPLDDLGLLLIEQPLTADDLWDHSRLQKEFATPICLDESVHALRHARQALEMAPRFIINIKPGRVGGLSVGAAIHNLCQEHGQPVWCGGMLETGVGRASNLAIASLPNFSLPGDISASARYYQQDITNEVFTLNPNSTITVPDQPGLGVTINQAALDAVTLRKETIIQ